MIAVVHGYGDHGGRYVWFGEAMAARGWAVYVYDLRGHGQSSGTRGQVKRFDDYLDDTDDLPRRGAPAASRGSRSSCSGTAWEGSSARASPRSARPTCARSSSLHRSSSWPRPCPRRELAAAKALAVVWPNKDIGNTVQAEQLSHDKTVVDAYVTDRLVHHVAPARWAAETLAAQDAAMAGAERIALPLYVLYGKDDQVVDVAFIEALFARAASAGQDDPSYEGLYHECFNEVGREQVYDDLAAWLAPRVR